jgi:hypothetical protein
MRLRFLGGDTKDEGCPSLYATDRDLRRPGWTVTDPEVRRDDFAAEYDK